ncbi:G5 and 3D domain-containing protein [Bacillus sp. USDA818B3_A]|uniref:ubiquitin-like domain-containing protein n=1 Tax=Bacillus sp. USDA818B3_A TaxID=2698834 RepID=UPI00136EBB40|nr:G5 and 3D domain-containing protein [Bacillus sp. USDA818B3_A]
MKNLFPKSLSGRSWTIIFASFVVLLTTLGILLFEGSKNTVAMTLDGKKMVVNTHADNIKELLDELDVPLNSKDYLYPKASTKIRNDLAVTWKQANMVHIVKDNEKKTIWTTADTVAGLLKEQKIVLKEHDQISPNPETAIRGKLNVKLTIASQLTYVDGGKARKVWTTSTTVADFLTHQGIKLTELDRVEPPLTENIPENGVVNVIRVEKVTDVVEEPVEFAVVTKKDENLQKGQEKVIAPGKQGRVSRQYEVVLENGKEVSRKLMNEQSILQKQDKVVAVGTKELALQVSRGEEPKGHEFYVTATAYTAYCNGCSGRTATGLNVRANPNMKVIAVDPRIIPLGSKVYVDGYGYAVAADTGGAIKGYIIDLLMPTKADAYRWGRKKVKITVLN